MMPSTGGIAEARWRAGYVAVQRFQRWGGEQLVRQMASIFLTDAPVRVAAVRAGLAMRDGPAVARAVHALRSSCAQFGAVTMQELCEEVEARAERNDLADIPLLVDRLETELADFGPWLMSLPHAE